MCRLEHLPSIVDATDDLCMISWKIPTWKIPKFARLIENEKSRTFDEAWWGIKFKGNQWGKNLTAWRKRFTHIPGVANRSTRLRKRDGYRSHYSIQFSILRRNIALWKATSSVDDYSIERREISLMWAWPSFVNLLGGARQRHRRRCWYASS